MSGAGKFTAHGSVKPDFLRHVEHAEKAALRLFQFSDYWGFRISVLKIRSSPHAWLNFILFSTTYIIMNSHIEIGKQNKYLN
ncbi:TPA: hypothetical protein ACI7EB_004945, partial [Escherichia coli]